jgi:hypothetical protein
MPQRIWFLKLEKEFPKTISGSPPYNESWFKKQEEELSNSLTK